MTPTKTLRFKAQVPWHQRWNLSLIAGALIAILLNGAFVIWLMQQPMPPIFFQLADNMNALFKPAPSPCPPFESAVIKNSHGKIIERQFVVPTFLVPHNRLPFPHQKPEQPTSPAPSFTPFQGREASK
ncbi:MAG: hypothetical protein V4507_10235 [Verrucomicrobiota bacterium]